MKLFNFLTVFTLMTDADPVAENKDRCTGPDEPRNKGCNKSVNKREALMGEAKDVKILSAEKVCSKS